jgi:hypothetical protein
VKSHHVVIDNELAKKEFVLTVMTTKLSQKIKRSVYNHFVLTGRRLRLMELAQIVQSSLALLMTNLVASLMSVRSLKS